MSVLTHTRESLPSILMSFFNKSMYNELTHFFLEYINETHTRIYKVFFLLPITIIHCPPHSLQGALSSAVCWNVLEEQLFLTKIGHNARMKEIFDFVREKQKELSESTRAKPARDGHPPSVFADATKLKVKVKNIKTNKRQVFQPKTETVQMLRWMLDYTTHLNCYPCPISPELALFVIAKDDMYIPRNGVPDVRDLWPGE